MLLWELHRRVLVTSTRHLEGQPGPHGAQDPGGHGRTPYRIARRIEQVSGDTILLNQGTIASLVRLQQRGLIHSEWGVSSNNRRAKFYSITRHGSRRLASSAQNWEQLSIVMGRFFAAQKESQQ
jgi:PadR family transcriptional regulator